MISIVLALLSCCVLLSAGESIAQADPPEEWLGRWEMLAYRGYVPPEYVEFEPADRQQIDLGIEAVSVWGGYLEETHVIPINWIGNGFEGVDNPPDLLIYPFITGCDPVGVAYDTEYSHPLSYDPPCPIPPCLKLSNGGCTDSYVYIYIRTIPTPVEPTPVEALSFAAIKALY